MESYDKKQLIYKFVLAAFFVACITAVITFYATYSVIEKDSDLEINKEVSENKEKNIETIAEALEEFRNVIDEYYIGEIDEQKMIDETIKGYVNGLDDEYSQYMTAEEWEEYQINTLGNYVGVGIYMSQDVSGNIVVIEPIEGSPAESAGVKSGDIIAEVNGESVSGQDTAEVSAKIKGEPGTTVNLKLVRDNEYVTLDVERKEIKVYHVKSEILENNIGYIKLSTFDENCSEEFKNAFLDVQGKGVQKLIIDLRNNTGGLVDEALKIADMIIEKDKKILITVDSKGNKQENLAEEDPIINMETIVLVNEYSASASEILVGALKDHGKAKVVGIKTFGKGVIQNVLSLLDGSVLKLTTAEYFTPNENKINKQGIEPDEVVEDIPEEEGVEIVDEQLNKAIELLK